MLFSLNKKMDSGLFHPVRGFDSPVFPSRLGGQGRVTAALGCARSRHGHSRFP